MLKIIYILTFCKCTWATNQVTVMVQSHDNNWLYILLCDFQLRTKKFYYHIHIAHFITRDFAHHELTQDEIDCRLVDGIAVAQRLQPCPHFVNGMYITLQDLLLQWLCHLLDVLNWCHLSSTIHPVRPSIRGREDCWTVRCRCLSSYSQSPC